MNSPFFRLSGMLFAVVVAAGLLSCAKEEPVVDPSISTSAKAENFISAEGGTLSFTVTSNVEDWTADTGGAAWINAKTGKNKLDVVVEANTLYENRSVNITLKARTASCSFKVIQAAAVFEPYLELSSGASVSVKAEQGTIDVTVRTNLDSWTCSSDQDWVTLTSSGDKMTVAYAANASEQERSAKVIVSGLKDGEILLTSALAITQAGADIHYETTDLSAGGTSNCYVITHMGPYTFNATVRGNGKTVQGLSAPEVLSPASAALVWQTSKGVILSVSYADGKISFEAGRIPGNALIAALDASGDIIWSWHIWRSESEVRSIKGADGSYVMNMNLGATTEDYSKLGCYGLLYQWGRKDPFPGSDRMNGGTTSIDNIPVYDMDGKVVDISYSSMYDTRCNTLAYSISHPTVCIAGEAQKTTCADWLTPDESNTALWGNPQGSVYDRDQSAYVNKGSKTYYDPCPLGWRVPHIQVMYHITTLGSLVWATGESEGVMTWSNLGGTAEFQGVDINKDGQLNLLDFQNGWWMYLDKSQGRYSFFPATSRYYGYWGQFMGSMVGYWGNYWTNTPSLNSDGSDSYKGIAVGFGIKEYGGASYSVTSTATAQGCRNDGYSIRCIKE